MKYEEALKYFKHRLSCGQCGENTTQRKAFEVAIECIKMQMPKKPYAQTEFYGSCPNCGRTIDTDFCQYCGQAIDFGGCKR